MITEPFSIPRAFIHDRFMMVLLKVLCTLIFYAGTHVCTAQSSIRCSVYNNCSDCIQKPHCDWCTKINITERNRCFNVEDKHECEEKFRINLQNKVENVHDFEDGINFMSPKEVALKLRVGVPQKINFTYKVQNYPLDLYILMDSSFSMLDDKHTISKLRSALNDTMRNITPDFRIGFGSFVDKDALPFVSIHKLRRECNGSCQPAYGFINHLPLNDNIDEFIDKITNLNMSGSLDNPEGGFDALMQVISCTEDIGWRVNSRKIILFATDETSHFAGDGKLAGIIRPNDASCHLNINRTYTESTQRDYPSISQINFKAKEKSIHIIFAVTMTCFDWYADLVSYIQGSSAAVLTNDSSNILSLIKEEYEKIIATVEMKDNATHAIKTVYFAEHNVGHTHKSNKIEGLKINSTANFFINISVESCDKLVEKHANFKINPIGISSSFLNIKLDLLCNCPCSMKGNEGYVENAEECNKQGTLECGMCICNQNYFGHHCECDSPITNVPCKQNNESNVVCSGRGLCICGKCECEKGRNADEEIRGKYCECDNFSCLQKENKMCSGNGKCDCGRCQCKENWSGDICECSLSKKDCMPPSDKGNLCFGNGNCTCGKCICSPEYKGKYCYELRKSEEVCSSLESCVMSKILNTTNDKPECQKTNIDLEDEVRVNIEKGEVLCFTSDYCHHKFVYKYGDDYKDIRAEKEKKCPEKANVSLIVFCIIGAILLLAALALLLWRVLTIMYDRAKFAKFEKQLMNSKFNTEENPLFKQATTTYRNPTYNFKKQ